MGKFIVFEGIDGSGKTTIAELLAIQLRNQGFSVKSTAEPTDGPIGKIIKKYLSSAKERDLIYEALLFAADRRWHNKAIIEPFLKKVDFVISDRYVYSSYAYQSGQDISIEWLEEINKYIIKPDYTFLIQISPEMGLSRLIESGRALRVTEKKETLYIVNKKYSEMVNKYGFVVLDGTRDPKNLVDEILHIIMGK